MVEIKTLNSIFNNDSSLALELWINENEKLKTFLKKTKLKANFFAVLSNNKFHKIAGLEDYMNTIKSKSMDQINFENTLSAELKKFEINHIFFKGAALSRFYYQKHMERQYTDNDILVDLRDGEKLYSFLDSKKLKHNSNFKFVNKIGYTRTALEVIQINEKYILDIHHRIFSKFFSKSCGITEEIFRDNVCYKDINHTSVELNLCISLYHSLIQSNRSIDLNFLLDFYILSRHNSLDLNNLEFYLNNFGLTECYKVTDEIVEKIKDGNCSNILKDKINSLMKPKLIKKQFYKSHSLKTQFYHFIDPEPYINMVSGSPSKNYFDFLKCKVSRLMLKLKR